jgi:hypothetical protein
MEKTWLQTRATLERMTVPELKLFLLALAANLVTLAIGLLWPEFVTRFWAALRYMALGLMFWPMCRQWPLFKEKPENVGHRTDDGANEPQGNAKRMPVHEANHSSR